MVMDDGKEKRRREHDERLEHLLGNAARELPAGDGTLPNALSIHLNLHNAIRILSNENFALYEFDRDQRATIADMRADIKTLLLTADEHEVDAMRKKYGLADDEEENDDD